MGDASKTIRIVSVGTLVPIPTQSEMELVISHLRRVGYCPLTRSGVSGMLTVAGIDGTDDPELIQRILIPDSSNSDSSYSSLEETHLKERVGELFVTGKVVYGIRSRISPFPGDVCTEIYAVGDGKQTEALSKFCASVEYAMKSSLKYFPRETKFSWKPTHSFLSSELHEIHLTERGIMDSEGCLIRRGRITSPDYSNEEAQAAMILVDLDKRQFLVDLSKRGGTTKKEVSRQPEIASLSALVSEDLTKQERPLTCPQDQHMIRTIPSYSLTDKGKHLITGNLWMYVWVTELLKRNGVENEGIIWKAEASGEDIDIIVEDFGSRFLFELKDTEFGLRCLCPCK